MKTNTESTHTDITSGLPWFMHGPDLLTPFSREVIMSQHGEVCRCAGPVDIQKANAALIVRAVNSHAELVQSLADLLAALARMDAARNRDDMGSAIAGLEVEEAKARALLARLEK